MDHVAPVLALIAVCVGGIVLLQLGAAWAHRIRRRTEAFLPTGEVDELRREVGLLREAVGELAERQDFAERLLAQGREREIGTGGQRG